MDASAEAEAARVHAGLAYVCGHLMEFRETLGDDGTSVSTPLSKLVAALQPGSNSPTRPGQSDIAALLDMVHKAVRKAGDPQGIFGSAIRQGINAVGVESLEIVYRCPLLYCAGRTGAEVTEFPPRCQVSGEELIRERLP